MKVTAVVLAAGSASRFGSVKLLAPLGDRPVLQHTLDAVAAAGLDDVVVVLGDAAAEIDAAMAWRGERRVVNPRPDDGLSSSLRLGLEAAARDPETEAALIVLGDQPAVRPAAIAAVVAAAEGSDRPFVRARYARDYAPNPVLVRRSAWSVASTLTGDRGLGPVFATRPHDVLVVDIEGANPDVDTPDDLAALDADHDPETGAAR